MSAPRHQDEPRYDSTTASEAASKNSLLIIIGCLVASVAVHGLTGAIIRLLDIEVLYKVPTDDAVTKNKKKRYRVKVKKRPAPKPKPKPAVVKKTEVPKRRIVQKFRPMAPPPMKVAPPVERQLVDLTPQGAGVNPNLTAGSGADGFQVGSTAQGDPAAGAPRPMAPRPMAPPPRPPPPPRPDPVYVKVLPKPVAVPRLAYPRAARLAGIQGTVKLLVVVNESGRVVSVRVVRGLGYGLDQVAVRALKQARFQPAIGSDGKPMRYTIRYYHYRFVLDE